VDFRKSLCFVFFLFSCKRHVNPENRILNTQISFLNPECADDLFSKKIACSALQKNTFTVEPDSSVQRSNVEPLGKFTSFQYDFRSFPVEGFEALKKLFQGSDSSPLLKAEPDRIYNLSHFFEKGFQAVLGMQLVGFEFSNTLAPLLGLMQTNEKNAAQNTIRWRASAKTVGEFWKPKETEDEAHIGDLAVAFSPKGTDPIHFGLVVERGYVIECTPILTKQNGTKELLKSSQKGTFFRMVDLSEFRKTASSILSQTQSLKPEEFKVVYLKKAVDKNQKSKSIGRIPDDAVVLSGAELVANLGTKSGKRTLSAYEHELNPAPQVNVLNLTGPGSPALHAVKFALAQLGATDPSNASQGGLENEIAKPTK
jgi:hypothetical protein